MIRSVSGHDQGLPEYTRPPVVEVALAIQFGAAIGYKARDLAEIADHWKDECPEVEERTPLPMMGFGSESPDVMLDVDDGTDVPRLWLQNGSGDRVVQLQQDRIVVNWKQESGQGTYPRYGSIREALRGAWRKLEMAVGGLGLQQPQPSVCEAQYINHLGPDQGWFSTEDTARLIAPWKGTMSDDFLPPNSHGMFLLHFHLPDQRGWLNIEGWPANHVTNEKMLVLNLTARGRASSPDLTSALDFMDLAHEWIVRGFTSVTTSEAHKIWERTR